MKKLLVISQLSEWYGNDERTEGRWKMKGGSDTEIATLTDEQAADSDYVTALYAAAYPLIRRVGKYFDVCPMDAIILEDGELTSSEKLEMEYSGRIIYGRVHLNWNPVRSVKDPTQFIVITALLTA